MIRSILFLRPDPLETKEGSAGCPGDHHVHGITARTVGGKAKAQGRGATSRNFRSLNRVTFAEVPVFVSERPRGNPRAIDARGSGGATPTLPQKLCATQCCLSAQDRHVFLHQNRSMRKARCLFEDCSRSYNKQIGTPAARGLAGNCSDNSGFRGRIHLATSQGPTATDHPAACEGPTR